MNLRGRKRVELKAWSRCNRKSQSQFASRRSQLQVAVRKSQVTQVGAVASQTLTLRGNECLDFVEVQKGLYTKVCHCFPSDSEHVRDNLLYFLTNSCVNQTHPYWRATIIRFATNRDLRSRRRVDFWRQPKGDIPTSHCVDPDLREVAVIGCI